ncbi:Baculoviral IAP repeat-containing protein [Hibiscus syriacus]|uniref:Baculoviral IAP repeat-containing protein n=2 Tax=Hibiscus syriacus TaxID=106335 RepID=A0A6A3CQ47_HIBSY|nr:Baculoviral IAP repeat-containing protein [Hibiscus syriacus]
MFQFLNPVLTNYGHCSPVNKVLTSILIALCGFSCAFSCFTDSYKDGDGMVHYGITTVNGLWPSSGSDSVELSKYKLRVGDFVHAFFSVIVFAVLSLLDSNTVQCFYPSFESTEKVLLMALPPVIGAISGSVFLVFPNTRHGIGYPSTSSSDAPDNSSDDN